MQFYLPNIEISKTKNDVISTMKNAFATVNCTYHKSARAGDFKDYNTVAMNEPYVMKYR